MPTFETKVHTECSKGNPWYDAPDIFFLILPDLNTFQAEAASSLKANFSPFKLPSLLFRKNTFFFFLILLTLSSRDMTLK